METLTSYIPLKNNDDITLDESIDSRVEQFNKERTLEKKTFDKLDEVSLTTNNSEIYLRFITAYLEENNDAFLFGSSWIYFSATRDCETMSVSLSILSGDNKDFHRLINEMISLGFKRKDNLLRLTKKGY